MTEEQLISAGEAKFLKNLATRMLKGEVFPSVPFHRLYFSVEIISDILNWSGYHSESDEIACLLADPETQERRDRSLCLGSGEIIELIEKKLNRSLTDEEKDFFRGKISFPMSRVKSLMAELRGR